MSTLTERGFVQSCLFRTYRAAVDGGLMKTPIGISLYEWSYGLYKARVEAPWLSQLRPYALPGSTVVDVGANIGFFTRPFARWVGPQGRVIAIEPEPANFGRLRRHLRREEAEGNVLLRQAAAADREGSVFLALNPYHPGDHRLSQSGIPVRALALDSLLEEPGLPPVSLIKIDVQGAEGRVVEGARRVIARHRPALCVEVDDAALRQQGSSCAALIQMIRGLGYRAHRLRAGSVSEPLQPDEAAAAVAGGTYADFLFLAEGAG